MGQRILTAFASNSNPSGGSERITKSDGAQGPPFLTIVAGFLVFLLVCWALGSIVTWLYGLIVKVPPLK
uniref:Uncharacterized protein n=1 Tax=Rhizophora mucronata TaxID=61149 RepID=A0A2P2QRI0_RHIMU